MAINLNPFAPKRSHSHGTNKRSIIALVTVVVGVLCAIYVWYLISGLPSLEQLENPRPELATKVYSIDGEVLDQFFIKNRTRA